MQVQQRSFRQPDTQGEALQGNNQHELNLQDQAKQNIATHLLDANAYNGTFGKSLDVNQIDNDNQLQMADFSSETMPTNGAQQYAMLKPILRNHDAMSPTNMQQVSQTIEPQGQALLGSRQRRTKSATKIGKGSRRGANQLAQGILQQYQQFQPSSTRANSRPMTGKLHPKDNPNHMSEIGSDPSSFIVNNLILNQPSTRNIKFSATQQMQPSIQNLDIQRLSKPTRKQSGYSRASGTGYATTAQTPSMNGQLSGGVTGPPITGDKSEQISIKHVTPELAAQVVKHFVLPMFDTDYKKGLRRKYGRMQAATVGPALTGKQSFAQQITSTSGVSDMQIGTVLGDLKLTEHLSNELEEVRNKFDTMHEALEKATLERDAYKKKFILLNSKQLDQKKEIDSLRQHLERQIKMNMGLELKLEQKIAQSEQLINISLVSEQMRKRFCDELRQQLAQNEALCNSHFNVKMAQTISNHSIQFLQEKFTILHDSVENISSDKRLGDKMEREIHLLKEKNDQLSEQVRENRDQISKVIAERDSFRADLNEMYRNKKKIEHQYEYDKRTGKERETKLTKQQGLLNKENNDLKDDLLGHVKAIKQLHNDKEKQKLRIQKLIQRKGKFDVGFKTCKNCTKEYNEKENMKWSCRQHPGEWGGEIWWCCGKVGKESLGCKYSSHESKDDEEDEDEQDGADGDKQVNKQYIRCACCKEVGHSIADCTRDPNIKTNAKADVEFERIQKMKDFRKLYADSVVQTTHLLKKSVMVPIRYDDDDQLEEMGHAYNPFMRGVMEFDDYNYAIHNPYVLVEDPKYAEEAKLVKKEDLGSARSQVQEVVVNQNDPMEPNFSQKNVNSSVTEEYEHNLVTIEKSEMEIQKEEEARQEAIAFEEAAKEKARKEQEKAKRKNSKASNMTSQEEEDKTQAEGEGENESKKGSEKDEVDEGEDDDDQDYQFRVFYRKEEIRMALANQTRDQFEDLIVMRQNTVAENFENIGTTRFNIMDFTPREKGPTLNIKKKKAGSMAKKGAVIDDEEDEDPNFDEFLADFEKKKKEKEDSEMTEHKLHEMEKANLEQEIKAMIKVKDTQSPDSSQNSRQSRKNPKLKGLPRRK